LGVFKPDDLHPVTPAPIKALVCLYFSRLWRKNHSHPLRGWSVALDYIMEFLTNFAINGSLIPLLILYSSVLKTV
jgi:hypothetical protein